MDAESGAAAAAYLSEFARTMERIEITARGGAALSIDAGVGAIIDALVAVRDDRRKALLIGNGGSAAIVSHLHNDLCKAVGARALVFNETPLLTALANDHGYEEVFCRPIALWADPGDLLIAVSSGGESANIVKAAALARDKGCTVVTFTGFAPANRLRQIGDVNVYVPASSYGYVEMAHSVVAHCICDFAAMQDAASSGAGVDARRSLLR